MREHTNVAFEGERRKPRVQHLLGDLWICGRNTTIAAVDGYTLPKKLNPYLIRSLHDIAYTPSVRMHTLSGAILRSVCCGLLLTPHWLLIIPEAAHFSTQHFKRKDDKT